jgi:hypothetical protein
MLGMKRPSRIGWAARNAIMAERMRARMQRSGRTPRGHMLWTKQEDEIIRRLYPNYKALRKALRRRTFKAIRVRASACGFTVKRHRWTAAEASRLRRLYPTASHEELLAAFPGVSLRQATAKANQIKVFRKRRPLAATGYPIIDEVRLRAFQLNITMVDLDAMSRTRCYFQKAGWHTGWISERAIYRAVMALDGGLSARWN